MTIIRTIPLHEASGSVAELYAESLDELGYAPTQDRVTALNPAARRAFEALIASVSTRLGTLLQALAVEVDVPPKLSETLRSALIDGL